MAQYPQPHQRTCWQCWQVLNRFQTPLSSTLSPSPKTSPVRPDGRPPASDAEAWPLPPGIAPHSSSPGLWGKLRCARRHWSPATTWHQSLAPPNRGKKPGGPHSKLHCGWCNKNGEVRCNWGPYGHAVWSVGSTLLPPCHWAARSLWPVQCNPVRAPYPEFSSHLAPVSAARLYI